MSDLVRYNAMCRAISEAYEIDEVKEIRDKALAFEAYAEQAKNIEAERQACEIRLRAERKAGQLLDKMERAKGHPGKVSRATTLSDLGVSRDQSSKWQKLAAVPEDDFESALNGEDKPSTSGILNKDKSKGTPMDEDALWLWGRLRDFENRGILSRHFEEVLNFGTEAMQADMQRLAGPVSHWLKGVPGDEERET